MTSPDVLRTMNGIIFIIGISDTSSGTILMKLLKMVGLLIRTLRMLFKDLMLSMIMDDSDLETLPVEMELTALFQCTMETITTLMNGQLSIIKNHDTLIIKAGGWMQLMVGTTIKQDALPGEYIQ